MESRLRRCCADYSVVTAFAYVPIARQEQMKAASKPVGTCAHCGTVGSFEAAPKLFGLKLLDVGNASGKPAIVWH